ncbi:RNA polymerase RpoE-like sigma-24 subunit [Anaerobacterium chartisolvens]|uniref:RNA polymerase RpoE-like sigma-24 subunit n=1 Tax=Anaerobacterium chartisolvens TaxID=1297424 RepID=A0A369BA12_9FIRM|nr:sigma-70 family RNA polymerase sigma factor [Anaerobacterium chartisolvens]RCX16524.1 RNA polymerase RpoE-like sigma-24 subunit [Anaerobacterium chartisolvens]
MNEGLLLEKAKKGDVEAFEQLIAGYQKRVFNIALKMIGNPEDASELAQETFIRVFKSIGKFKEESLFSTWIYRIATNICLDELRKRKGKKEISLDEDIKLENGEVSRQIEDTGPSPEAVAERNELRRKVNDAIGLLTEEHRLVIIMRDIQGFSYEEIAKITGCPEGTVKSRINRARQSLKQLLKDRVELLNEEYVK